MASSKSRTLTRDIILSAALELVDDAGLSALSLRSLGKRLGVSQAAFYRHFPDKAALLEGICEQLWRLTYERFLALVQGSDAALDDAAPGASATAAAPARPDPSPDTEPGSSLAITPQTAPNQALQAQEYIRQYANCLRATLQDHPNTVILLMTHPISTPEQLSLLAGVLASLARSGFTPTTDTLALITSVSVYTTGFVAAEVVPPAGTSDDAVAKPGSAALAAPSGAAEPATKTAAPAGASSADTVTTPAAPSEGADDAVVAVTEDLMAVSAMLDPADAAALQPLIGEVLAGKWDFSAQFERGLEAILRGW
ncbi:transcriptional regulator, TetR family [Actinomyces graevenitzii F0530]|uniref:Transcriptional regulator, TetR family n=1 Tax=Actinomyces graevenitzii F0530 TaxID=1321817 RepID=U1RFY5_9ACTO|nr:transcriptional regulator, TetR family [Actinomyces graevenitzii F0530]